MDNQIKNNAMGQPKILTRDESHQKVLGILKDKPKGKLLDIPSGEGALALELKKMGFDVSCCDIDPGLFRVDSIEIKKGNLNERLPYNDQSFDYVACIAGIHRVIRFQHAIDEFKRILKPTGELIISFPNYSNIERRIKFLFTGSISKVVNQMSFHEHYTEDPDAFFRQLLLFPQMYFALQNSGFQITDVVGDKLKHKSLALLPLAWLIKTISFFSSQKNKQKYCLKYASSLTLLIGGNNIIINAKKS